MKPVIPQNTDSTPPRHSTKAGALPGSLIYTGTKAFPTRISLIRYDQATFSQLLSLTPQQVIEETKEDSCNWILVSGFQDIPGIEQLGNHFGISPLTQEDIFNVQHLPSIEESDNSLFITLKLLSIKEKRVSIDAEQISLFLGKNILITFQEKESSFFDTVIERLKNNKGKGRLRQEDFLAYLLIDQIVDQYYLLLDHAEDQIELLEKSLFRNTGDEAGHRFLQFKKNLVVMRKNITPLKELIRNLSKEDSGLLQDITREHFRDISDHLSHILQTLDSYREMITAMLELQAANSSNRMNSIMKTLTLVSTIFIPLSFAAGIYGMNFRYMPELEWKYSYPVFLILMLLTGTGMYIFMRRKRWF